MTDEVKQLRDALEDLLSGWQYIRHTYGDLSGVGWDRAQDKAIAALAPKDETAMTDQELYMKEHVELRQASDMIRTLAYTAPVPTNDEERRNMNFAVNGLILAMRHIPA